MMILDDFFFYRGLYYSLGKLWMDSCGGIGFYIFGRVDLVSKVVFSFFFLREDSLFE